jgi:hypothetical protein
MKKPPTEKTVTRNALKESFRCCSGPVIFLAGVSTALGLLFLSVGSGAGWIFIATAASALGAFSLRGAMSGVDADRGGPRLLARVR